MLWDNQKLSHINNIYLSNISNQELYNETLTWAKTYKTDYAQLLESDPELALAALSIERHTEQDPKRFNTYADTESQVRFFFDDEYERLWVDHAPLPEMMTTELADTFVSLYKEKLDLTLTTSERFAQLKDIGKEL